MKEQKDFSEQCNYGWAETGDGEWKRKGQRWE